ncbi:hypothetical protein [Lactococcus lactis]|uniref:Uncharacterized protein n=1 Tax=Lactococcus lactis TaxID=1358 RepID=A0AAW5TJ98_9LACT|nr:hypothetical protein [Lactococcus lactis]MCW2281200.1 hypothetical protein [Lactococcus lactis]
MKKFIWTLSHFFFFWFIEIPNIHLYSSRLKKTLLVNQKKRLTKHIRIELLSMMSHQSRYKLRYFDKDNPELYEKIFEGVDWSKWDSEEEMRKLRIEWTKLFQKLPNG